MFRKNEVHKYCKHLVVSNQVDDEKIMVKKKKERKKSQEHWFNRVFS